MSPKGKKSDLERDIVALEAQARAAEQADDPAESSVARQKALALAARLARPALVAALIGRTGDALMRHGDVQGAVSAFDRALQTLAAEPSTDLAELLARLAEIPKYFGDHATFEVPDLYTPEAAGDLAAEERDPALVVKLLIRSGNAYLEQPQDKVAMSRYEEAIARPEAAAEPMLRAHALSAIALLFRRAGRLGEAERALGEAFALFDARPAAPEDRRRALLVRAGLEGARGEPDRAQTTLESAIPLYVQARDPRGEGRALVALGSLHLRQGRFDDARPIFERARALADKANDPDTKAVASLGLGRCLRRAGALDEAAAMLDEALSAMEAHMAKLWTEEGKVTFMESAGEGHDELVALQLERAARDPSAYRDALDAAERARGQALRDLIGERRRSRPLVQVAKAPAQQHHQIAPGIPSEHGDGRWVDAEERDVAPLARLVLHTLEDRTAVFAIDTSDVVRGHTIPVGRSAWELRVTQLRNRLGIAAGLRGVRGPAAEAASAAPGVDEADGMLRTLYDEIVAPIEAALPAGEPVVIEPHGPLWVVPFAALRRRDGAWLGEIWPLVHAPSRAILDEIRREAEPPRPAELPGLIVGDPTMPEVTQWLGVELVQLEGALAEAQAIAGRIAEGRRLLLTGEAASRAAVEEALPRSGFVHLATHGLADPDDPLASFVVLAEPPRGDSLLTARRILDLSLNRLTLGSPDGSKQPTISTDLVVLSACQTGLGRVTGDGVIGLSRALLAAGARSVVVSLWSVSDAATSALMVAFYDAYLADGDKAAALMRAMKAVRSTPGWEAPRYWAPFVLIGAER